MLGIVRRRSVLKAGDPCIVHDNVDARADFQQAGPRTLVGDIHCVELGADPCGGGSAALRIDVGDEDVRTLADEGSGDRGTDAARPAGDKRLLA